VSPLITNITVVWITIPIWVNIIPLLSHCNNAYNYTISARWFGTWFLFSIVYGIINPTDELIFFRGVGSTTNQQKNCLGFTK
jgi:hypothetical protein